MSQATWRFHEDGGKREYKLKPRATQAETACTKIHQGSMLPSVMMVGLVG